jgi:hypothetical protein
MRLPLIALAAMLPPLAAHAQDAPLPADIPPPPPLDQLMTDDELTQAFTGADLEGCYPDGNIWAERTATDGTLYDLLRRGVAVGEWWVEDRQICYFYSGEETEAQGIFCWNVLRQRDEYYFLAPGTGLVGGTTDCGDPVA